MDKPSIELIHEVMKDSGMVVFQRPYDVTLGGVRTNDNRSGKFNDWLFASLFDHDDRLHSIIVEGTTDAGLYYRENPMNVDGTAIIMHNVQHRGCYEYQNPKESPGLRGHRGQEAFRQVAPMRYWRDADRDLYLDFDGLVQEDNFATNGHFMGLENENVGKNSAGCWGGHKGNMHLIFGFARAQISHGLGKKFSYALLHEQNF